MSKISQSPWCFRKDFTDPDHYGYAHPLTRVSFNDDTLVLSAHVGTDARGYDVRVSVDLEEMPFSAVRNYYRRGIILRDEDIAAEIAFLSDALDKSLKEKRAAKLARARGVCDALPL